MTTTATKIEKRSAAAEMTDAGNQQLAELRHDIEELEGQITGAMTEIEALQQAKMARTDEIAEARAVFAEIEGSYNRVLGYAKLAHQKPHEHEAVKAAAAAKKNWQETRKSLASLIEQDEASTSQANEREAVIRKQVYLLTSELETRRAEERVVKAGWEKAHSELGIERYEALVAGFQQKQALVDEALSQLTDARVEAHTYHEQALAELAEWPDLAADMARMVPKDDASLRAITVTLQYLEMVQRDFPLINELPPELKRRGLDIWTVLYIGTDELQRAHLHPEWLESRKELTRRLLAEYQNWLSMQ